MKNQSGFTFIELIVFIMVTSILASILLLSYNVGLTNSPKLLQNTIATQTAEQCLEWFIGQRRVLGYSAFSCPYTTVPAFCSAPTGYTLSVNISCATISSDTNFQNITISVTGNGNATLTSLVGSY